VLCAVVCIVVLFVAASPVGAHPLGNFTVNHYARLEASAGLLRVYYVVDEAEIPAFQRRDEVGDDPDAFAERRAEEIAAGLDVEIDGAPVTLEIGEPVLSQPEGEAGLATLRLAVIYTAPLVGGPGTEHEVRFTDRNEPERLGWREVIAVARGDTVLLESDVPDEDVSDELRSYPSSRLRSPLNVRAASLTVREGSEEVDAVAIGDRTDAVEGGDGFVDLIAERDLGVLGLLGALVTALGFGAVHALAPGHGKTLMAAYLVGTRGRARDAVLLGSIVSAMHTASVLVLGLILYHLARDRSPESIYPGMQVAAGVVVVGWGLLLLRRRVAIVRAGSTARSHVHHDHDHHDHHGHGHDGHGHDEHEHPHDDHVDDHHEHEHHHGPGGHTHELPADTSVLSRRGITVLAVTGGIFPSPSALLVVLSAFSLGRIALGLALVAAFSLGLAGTLTVVGLALIRGRRFIDGRRATRFERLLPVVSAAAIVLAGGYLLLRGLQELGS